MGFSPDIKMESIEEEREALGYCCIIWKKGRKKLVEIWQDNGTSSSFISNQQQHVRWREQAISMKIICKCSSQHSPLYSVEALPNFRFFVCLAVRWILVVLPTVYYSLSKPIRQNCAFKKMRFFWNFQPQCIKNSFTFQDILQQEKAIFIRWNIELSIILVND